MRRNGLKFSGNSSTASVCGRHWPIWAWSWWKWWWLLYPDSYAPGGILFGPLLGGALALAGNVLGSGIACLATRSLGGHWLERFFSPEKLRQAHSSLEQQGPWLIFLLRINPLTSSDLVSYAAGLTRIPVWKVMLATGVGMAPLCFAQAWLAESLLTSFPVLIYPLAVGCGAYLIAVLLVVRQLVKRPA